MDKFSTIEITAHDKAILAAFLSFDFREGDGIRLQKITPDGEEAEWRIELAVEGTSEEGTGPTAEEQQPWRFRFSVSPL
jgi:hypothetical protein